MQKKIDPGSFRDPSGCVFLKDKQIYRQINKSYKPEFDLLENSGLLSELHSQGLLIQHVKTEIANAITPDAYAVIIPESIPFITYPYEWSFSQLKDAALLTLEIQNQALRHGMILKDASAYNVQFLNGKPVFIDTLSFERYNKGDPWIAYGQFCRHFLAPLALMSKTDISLNQLLRMYIDGIPLPLVRTLLPKLSQLNPGLLIHLFLHAKSQTKTADYTIATIHEHKKTSRLNNLNSNTLLGITDSLINTIKSLRWKPAGTNWAEYYKNTNYTGNATEKKEQIVKNIVDTIRPVTVWDIGANDGKYSRIASLLGAGVISFDIDPAAVEKNYLTCRTNSEKNILPLLMDFTNPSPGLGWNNIERKSLSDRGPADLVIALALIHHIAIGNNVPFQMIASFFSSICKHLLIEFVPKSDSQVQRMLSMRKDIFEWYEVSKFEEVFSNHFKLISKTPIEGSGRSCYYFIKEST